MRTKKIKYVQVFYLALAAENGTPLEDQTLIFLTIFFLIVQYIFEYILLVTDSNNTEVYILSCENP